MFVFFEYGCGCGSLFRIEFMVVKPCVIIFVFVGVGDTDVVVVRPGVELEDCTNAATADAAALFNSDEEHPALFNEAGGGEVVTSIGNGVDPIEGLISMFDDISS